jgi:hypothetical protein
MIRPKKRHLCVKKLKKKLLLKRKEEKKFFGLFFASFGLFAINHIFLVSHSIATLTSLDRKKSARVNPKS